MKPEDIQHGGNHYKDQPKHLQPIYLATALKLNPMEYSVLKYLLRHRKKGGLLDLQKMMHFAQMLWEENHGQAPQITYLTPAKDAEFEFHKEQADVQLAALIRLLGFQITDAEYAILRCLLRHKSNGKMCELRELLQYGQWLIYSEYGMVAVLKRQDEPIDAEFEVVPKSQPVTSDNPQSPACRFKVGDIIGEHYQKAAYRVVRVDEDFIDTRSIDNDQIPYVIVRGDWRKYSVRQEDAVQQQDCPFKIGDVIQHYDTRYSKTKWKITHIKSNMLLVTSHDQHQTPSWIERPHWGNYRVIEETGVDNLTPTC